MKIVYENIDAHSLFNLTNCTDLNNSGIGRVTVSPVISTLIRIARVTPVLKSVLNIELVQSSNLDFGEKYIIPIGVAHSPHDWCGPDKYKNGYDEKNPDRKSLFEFLPEQYLRDLRKGKAFFLIDQTHEGYQTDWLWQWFHNNCDDYGIHPGQIIYITGNIDSQKQYKEWADRFELVPRMLVIPLPHFEFLIYEISRHYISGPLPPGVSERRRLPDFSYHLEYKQSNLNNIAMFNVLQKRARAYRLWFFKYLFENNLIDGNIISMNKFDLHQAYFEDRFMTQEDCDKLNAVLPMLPKENPANYQESNFVSLDGGDYISSLNDLTMLDSWCTVVSEASYGDREGACFLSEKTFKPIVCQHPFIIFGSKGSLSNLRDLGYKTFHPYIDESYDELPTWERMDAIIKEMARLNSMSNEQRVEWYKNLEPIISHNYVNLEKRWTSYASDIYQILRTHIGE